MGKRIKNIIKFTVFLIIGFIVFWFVYRKQNAEKILNIFKGVDYFWLGMTVLIMIISHLSRSVRWVMLIEPLGKKVSFINTALVTFLGYFANMALPRMGEVTRCAALGKYEKLPMSKLLGTVVVERAIDFITFLLCMIVAVILQFNMFAPLIDQYLLKKNIDNQDYHIIFVFLGITIFLIILYYLLHSYIERTRLYVMFKKMLQDVKEGFRVIWRLKSLKWFIFHTILIWVCYYLMMYFGFKVFTFSSNLSAVIALSIFVLGSLGMILPSPGGIGSFHFFVTNGLVLYLPHIPDIDEKAAAFALLIHGVQTIFVMISGIISLILLPIINRKK